MKAALVAAVAVLVSASGMLYLRSPTNPVTVSDAVRRFRDAPPSESPVPGGSPAPAEVAARRQTSGPATAAPVVAGASRSRLPVPAEGVYAYHTTGWEDVDVLGGSRHDYPATTTITVRHAGCGLVERWDALAERWDERETCPTPAGEVLRRVRSHHEFFRHADERELTCDEGTLAHPADDAPGTTWTGRCTSGPTTVELTGSIVGRERVDVGGVVVDALHVRVESRVTGDQQGTGVHDTWGDPRTRLVVLERASMVSYSDQPVLGRTRYREEYEIRLTSFDPRR